MHQARAGYGWIIIKQSHHHRVPRLVMTCEHLLDGKQGGPTPHTLQQWGCNYTILDRKITSFESCGTVLWGAFGWSNHRYKSAFPPLKNVILWRL